MLFHQHRQLCFIRKYCRGGRWLIHSEVSDKAAKQPMLNGIGVSRLCYRGMIGCRNLIGLSEITSSREWLDYLSSPQALQDEKFIFNQLLPSNGDPSGLFEVHELLVQIAQPNIISYKP